MASLKEIELMMGKVILDPEFRKEVKNSPEDAAKKLGLELTPEQAKAFKAHDLHVVAEKMDKIESKSLLYTPGTTWGN